MTWCQKTLQSSKKVSFELKHITRDEKPKLNMVKVWRDQMEQLTQFGEEIAKSWQKNWRVPNFYKVSCNYWLWTGSTVAEHSTHNPKIKGSNPAPGLGREKLAKEISHKHRDIKIQPARLPAIRPRRPRRPLKPEANIKGYRTWDHTSTLLELISVTMMSHVLYGCKVFSTLSQSSYGAEMRAGGHTNR